MRTRSHVSRAVESSVRITCSACAGALLLWPRWRGSSPHSVTRLQRSPSSIPHPSCAKPNRDTTPTRQAFFGVGSSCTGMSFARATGATELGSWQARPAAQLLAGGEERKQSQSEINLFRVTEANKDAVIRYVPAPIAAHARIFITRY